MGNMVCKQFPYTLNTKVYLMCDYILCY